jgi:carbon-monoxide dehydrogenase medium subunit
MALVVLRVADGVVIEARIGIGGVGETPLRASDAESELVGTSLGVQDIERASNAASGSIATLGDIHASAEYRSDLVGVMTRRALMQAANAGRLSHPIEGRVE